MALTPQREPLGAPHRVFWSITLRRYVMKSKLKILAVALFASTAAVAMAQAPNRAQSFADQFRQMQTLSANTASTYAYKPAPVVGARAQDPVAGESFHDRFADMQAESSNSSEFEPAP